jgi:hypothetical protein
MLHLHVTPPFERDLDALPMGNKRAGFSAIGILGDMADHIASPDGVFAEEAWVSNLRMVAAERPELSKPHLPQIDRRLHLEHDTADGAVL